MRSSLLAFTLLLHGVSARADALVKLKADRLEAVRRAVMALRAERREWQRADSYRDYRANLHVHSYLSHDSRGQLDDIVAAAKRAGTTILMFTEHPSDRYDYFADGHRGIKDGVLLIPGAETNGLLCFPTRSLRGLGAGSTQEFSDLIRSRGGLVFLSHLEERMDWNIPGLTGTEIYNTHADFKDEKNLIAAMRNPLWVFQVAPLFRKYPQEAFSALQDYPADYLRRWDELCSRAPHTGVAANDSHQNVGVSVKLLPGEKVRIEDALGEKLFELNLAAMPLLQPLRKDKQVGATLFQMVLDSYEYSLRHVGTHLLLREQTQKEVWDALENGRAFVAFDWLADSTGFDFFAESAGKRYPMGSRLSWSEGLKLQARAPLPVHWKLMRDGKLMTEVDGYSMEATAAKLGIYRVEAWLEIAGEKMIWVLSNPIYVRKPEGK
jgi:hypothetical protein